MSGCSPSLDVRCDGNETTPESDETEDEVEGAERVTSNSPPLVNCWSNGLTSELLEISDTETITGLLADWLCAGESSRSDTARGGWICLGDICWGWCNRCIGDTGATASGADGVSACWCIGCNAGAISCLSFPTSETLVGEPLVLLGGLNKYSCSRLLFLKIKHNALKYPTSEC